MIPLGGLHAQREGGKENKYSCVVLAGMRGMEERRRNLKAFHEGDVRFLICTDVAARGLDVRGLPYVINVTLPDRSENYIHRIGRVGRLDRLGLAISLVATRKERVWYHTCSRKDKGRGCRNVKLVRAAGGAEAGPPSLRADARPARGGRWRTAAAPFGTTSRCCCARWRGGWW